MLYLVNVVILQGEYRNRTCELFVLREASKTDLEGFDAYPQLLEKYFNYSVVQPVLSNPSLQDVADIFVDLF